MLVMPVTEVEMVTSNAGSTGSRSNPSNLVMLVADVVEVMPAICHVGHKVIKILVAQGNIGNPSNMVMLVMSVMEVRCMTELLVYVPSITGLYLSDCHYQLHIPLLHSSFVS